MPKNARQPIDEPSFSLFIDAQSGMSDPSGTSQLELWSDPGAENRNGNVSTAACLFAESSPQLEPSFAEKRPLQILVADDNEINRKVIRIILEKLGYACEETCDGRETFERFKQKRRKIDYIFMDIDMPEMSGLDAARAIRKAEEAAPKNQNRIPTEIIAVTANVSDETRLACRRAGMNGYLEKPITLEIIRDQLLKSWNKIRTRRNEKRA